MPRDQPTKEPGGAHTYGFRCTSCDAAIAMTTDPTTTAPYQSTVTVLVCHKCGESHAYAGPMVRLSRDDQTS